MTTEVALDATDSTLATRSSGTGPTVNLVHGFAQTGECLGPLASALHEHHMVRRVDAPGHGASVRHLRASLDDGAALLGATGGDGVYVGYSMGARLCLHTAVVAPGLLRALVLIGATAGIDDPAEREQRRLADRALAARVEEIGVAAFLDEWLALDMFAGLPRWARFDRERRTNTARGLAESLRNAGTGTMEPLWGAVHRIDVPVLCLSGALDVRYGAMAERLVDSIGGNARHVVIDDAGHAAHLERPEPTIAAVAAFLAEC